MNLPQEIIRKKRDGKQLSRAEILEFFIGFQEGRVADYQVAAMLMAIFQRGMDFEETAELTRVMRDSGRVLTWDRPKEHVVDKHSTGGVGDKTSLIILPLATLEGVVVPMMSGRGLGHTGGTLDKLEAIPGMKVRLDVESVQAITKKFGGVFLGQTSEITPLDQKLYAMRDVTSTVESIPLITASILSKKLAEGLGGLVMDVKFGSGAFMSRYEDAEQLATTIAGVARACGLKTSVLLTSMDSPLGDRAGNALEVVESIEVLRGTGPASTRELSIELTAAMIELAFPDRDIAEIRGCLDKHLSSGRAFEQFCRIVSAQGGDSTVLNDPSRLPVAPVKVPVQGNSGVVTAIDVRSLGVIVQELGGGRRLVTDKIDPSVGLSGLKRVGDKVNTGEPLGFVHARDSDSARAAAQMLQKAYTMGDRIDLQRCELIRKRLA